MEDKLLIHGAFRKGMAVLTRAMMKSTTTRECAELMNESGLFRKTCCMDGIPLYMAKQVASAYFKLFLDYPFLAARTDGVNLAGKYSRSMACCYMLRGDNEFAGGAVLLNTSYYKYDKWLDRCYRGPGQEGYHPENTDYRAIITHELGHVLDGYLTGARLAGIMEDGRPMRVSTYIRKSVLKKLDVRVREIPEELSGYAKKNPAEWFAECFAEYMESPRPREMCIECMSMLKNMLQKAYIERCADMLNMRRIAITPQKMPSAS